MTEQFIKRLFFICLIICLCTIGRVQIGHTQSDMSFSDMSFAAWLAHVKQEARQQGLSEATLATLDGLAIDTEVLRLATRQPEYIRPPWAYLDTMLSPIRKKRGNQLLVEHKALFDKIETRYGVDRHILAAIWGIETNFGKHQGNMSVLRSLASLGHQGGRRTKFGRQQLLAALTIIENGDIDAPRMLGSWAGAMGQTQFIPTTYQAYAVDFDGDGKRDIWHNRGDALGSAAHYLQVSGWRGDVPWGYEVTLPSDFDFKQADMAIRKPLRKWRKQGVRAVAGALPNVKAQAALFLPAGYRGPAFLVTDNFRALLRYNTAHAYALAVGLLSDFYRSGASIQADWPLDARPLQPSELKTLQRHLTKAGYDTGGIDGILGQTTRAAIRRFQIDKGFVPDGYASAGLLTQFTLDNSPISAPINPPYQ